MGFYRRHEIQAKTTVTTAEGNVDILISRGSPEAQGGEFEGIPVVYVKTEDEVATASLVVSIWNVVMGQNVLAGQSTAITTETVSGIIFGGGSNTGAYDGERRPVHAPFIIRQDVSGAGASFDTTVELHWLPVSMHQ